MSHLEINLGRKRNAKQNGLMKRTVKKWYSVFSLTCEEGVGLSGSVHLSFNAQCKGMNDRVVRYLNEVLPRKNFVAGIVNRIRTAA